MDRYYREQFQRITLLHKKKERLESKRKEVTCNGAFIIYTDIIKDIEEEIRNIEYRLIFMEG